MSVSSHLGSKSRSSYFYLKLFLNRIPFRNHQPDLIFFVSQLFHKNCHLDEFQCYYRQRNQIVCYDQIQTRKVFKWFLQHFMVLNSNKKVEHWRHHPLKEPNMKKRYHYVWIVLNRSVVNCLNAITICIWNIIIWVWYIFSRKCTRRWWWS